MNSPHQREQLPDLLCGALEANERARVESHLAQCEQCARELRALEQMQQSLAALPAEAPPARLRAGVRAALRQNNRQSRGLAAFLAERARAKNAAQSGRPIQSSERIGARQFALPFALPARQLAWGGAVAVSAIGLMLLARPSLHNGTLSQSASPVAQADRTAESADAASDQNAQRATDSAASKKATGASKPGVPTKKSSRQTNASAPAIAAGSNAPLPPLPPPPSQPSPRTRNSQPNDFAPSPPVETPAVEPKPKPAPAPPKSTPPKSMPPRNDTRKPRADESTKNAPVAPVKPPGQAAAPVEPSGLATAPKTETAKPAPQAISPASPPSDAPSKADSGKESSNFAGSSTLGDATADSARDNEPKARRSAIAPPAPGMSASGAFRKRDETADKWTGGDVAATLRRGDAALAAPKRAFINQAPVLTISVTKAIGNARLFLILPAGEIQVWRGSMNAAPVEITLNNPELERASLRSGQQIRARLEQIDGSGNPIANTTFPLVWP